MNIIISYAISILYTILLYGAGPLMLLKFRKKPITKKRLKVFSVIYSFSAWLCSNIFWGIYAGDDVSSGGAAILWGSIFYAYMKREFEKTWQLVEKMPAIPKVQLQEQETNMGKFVVDTETGEIVKEPNTPPEHHDAVPRQMPVASEPRPEKKRQFPMAIGVLSFLCLALAICSLCLWNETQYLNSEIKTLSEENSKLEVRVSDISEKIAKKDVECQKLQNEKAELESKVDSRSIRIIELTAQLKQIGYVVNGSKYYHRFEIDTHSWDSFYQGASHFKCVEFPDDVEYWAHNIDYCAYLGYSPCPICW